MRIRFHAMSALVLAAVAFAAVGAACSSDDKKDESSSSGGAAAVAAKGGNLSDCDYAKAAQGVIFGFATSMTTTADSLGSSSTPQDVTKAFDSYNNDMNKLIKDLQGLKVSGDLAKFNGALITLFQDVQKQLPELKKTATSDPTKVDAAVEKFSTDFGTKLDKIGEQYKSTTEKLGKCEA